MRVNKREPSTAERRQLARIYGDEKNWIGVATDATKRRKYAGQ